MCFTLAELFLSSCLPYVESLDFFRLTFWFCLIPPVLSSWISTLLSINTKKQFSLSGTVSLPLHSCFALLTPIYNFNCMLKLTTTGKPPVVLKTLELYSVEDNHYMQPKFECPPLWGQKMPTSFGILNQRLLYSTHKWKYS